MSALPTPKSTDAALPAGKAVLPEFDREMINTRKILECVPEDRFAWKPHEKSMTLGQLATHVADLVSFGATVLERDGVNRTGQSGSPATSPQELLERFDRNLDKAREQIAQATNERMAQTWTLKVRDRVVFELPRALVLRTAMMNHLIHHRGQLTVYLRLNGVSFPGMYGPTADDQKPAPEPARPDAKHLA